MTLEDWGRKLWVGVLRLPRLAEDRKRQMPSERRASQPSCLLGSDAEHRDGVGGDLGGEGGGGFAEVFFGPDVADGGGEMAGIAEVFPGNRDFGVGGAAIEQHDGAAAVFHLFSPHFGVAVLADAAALHAKGILVDGDDFLVGEDVLDLRRHVLQIVSGHERSGEDAPKAEVRAVLGGDHAAVADFEHIGIIPVARAGVGFQANLQVQNLREAKATLLAFPTVGDVASGAPEVANVSGPEPRLVRAPLAEAENNGAARGLQSVAHGGVGGLGVFRAGVAPIVFEVVDAPGGVLEGVLKFMAAAARTFGAGHGAGVGVDAKFQALGMDVIGESLNAGGEIFGVGDDVAGIVAADLPAIVNDDVFVAGILHAAADEGVGGGFDEIFADVASETVPTVPAHGRGESQTILEGGRGWNARKKSEEERQRQTTYYFIRKTFHEILSAYSHLIFRAHGQNCPRSLGARARVRRGERTTIKKRSS